LTAPADAPTSGVDEPDAGLIERYDLPASGRHRLDGFDGIIDRKDPAFLAMIDEVAAEYGIPPSVLLANWLRETGGRDHAGEVTNRQNGMPSWHGRRGDDDLGAGIADRRLPGVYDDGVALDRPLYAFATERDAMRAHAAWLADSQERFVDHVGEEEWNALPLSVQGALLRLTFNPGRNNPLTWADRAVAARQDGQDPASAFPQTGGFDSRHPLRTAQSAGAQAAHFHNEGLFPAN
jgi:hypothetical protein